MKKLINLLAVVAVLGIGTLSYCAQNSLNVEKMGSLFSHWNSINDIAVRGNYAYLIDDLTGFMIMDISDPANPLEISRLPITEGKSRITSCFALSGDYAYIFVDAEPAGSLSIVDISDPFNPQILPGTLQKWYVTGTDLIIRDDYAYMSASGGLTIFDVSDPNNMKLMNAHNHFNAWGMDIKGDYAFLADWNLSVVDISNPASPRSIVIVDTRHSTGDIAINGDYAYLSCPNYGLLVYDISDPLSPTLACTLRTSGSAQSITIDGDYAYIAGGSVGGMRIISIVDPTSPIEVGAIVSDRRTRLSPRNIAIAGNHAFVSGDNHWFIADITDKANPTLIHHSTYEGGELADVAIDSNLVFLTDGRPGLQIVDISDLSSPKTIGNLSPKSDMYKSGVTVGMDCDGKYVYLTDLIWGLLIIDYSDPTAPIEIGSIPSLTDAYSVTVTGNYAYVSRGTAGTVIVDISNPVLPVEIGTYKSWRNVLYSTVRGDFLYEVGEKFGLHIVDISDPTFPALVAEFQLGDVARGVALYGDYAFVAASGLGLIAIDITDPSNPHQVGAYNTGGSAYEVSISGNFAYLADMYGGLRVVDISNPTHLKETGYYDTPGLAYNVTVRDGHVFLADGLSFGIYDCSRALDVPAGDDPSPLPHSLTLQPAYPNPFNSTTRISYQIPKQGMVNLTIYDLSGREVATMVNGILPAGNHAVTWTANGVPAGTYLIKLSTAEKSIVNKVVILR